MATLLMVSGRARYSFPYVPAQGRPCPRHRRWQCYARVCPDTQCYQHKQSLLIGRLDLEILADSVPCKTAMQSM